MPPSVGPPPRSFSCTVLSNPARPLLALFNATVKGECVFFLAFGKNVPTPLLLWNHQLLKSEGRALAVTMT